MYRSSVAEGLSDLIWERCGLSPTCHAFKWIFSALQKRITCIVNDKVKGRSYLPNQTSLPWSHLSNSQMCCCYKTAGGSARVAAIHLLRCDPRIVLRCKAPNVTLLNMNLGVASRFRSWTLVFCFKALKLPVCANVNGFSTWRLVFVVVIPSQ